MRRLLSLAVLVAAGCATSADRAPSPRFDAVADADAWAAISPDAPALPLWARILAPTLPGTTAAQLELDHVQRARNPLGPALAGKIRWVVADANRCGYAKERAEQDLAKASVKSEDVARLGDVSSADDADRQALEFARKLTLAAASLTDDEVASLIARYGPDDVVAIVHTVAHANFEHRLFLALGLATEPSGHPAPRRAGIPAAGEVIAPARLLPESVAAVGTGTDVAWSDRTGAELRDLLEQQKKRTARIEKPDEVRLARLPKPQRSKLGRVAWGTISAGYQPELTKAWYQTMETFSDEAKLDEVFTHSVFWVVTRTSDCFY